MRTFCFVLAVTFLSFVGSAQVRAQDVTIQVQDLPKEVVDAVTTKFPDAQLQKAKQKVVDGKSFIGVGLTSKGTAHSLLLTPKGKFVELKKVIPASELPAKVVEAVYAAYPNSTTSKAEKVTVYKEEKSFKLEVLTSDKQTRKLVVSADGKIVEPK
jgi:hypothetical protein